MWQLLADLAGCRDFPCEAALRHALKDLCIILDMRPLGEPQVVEVEGPKPGMTAVQIISDSDISIHTFPTFRKAYANVFSCKPFRTEPIEELLRDLFFPEHMTLREIEREPLE